ncbi:MAG: glycerol-3-phosphate 1-O-acyltransferase PlsY [Oscillospiraceae bacterium]|jgi:glycerol-3-phosphate acyltransferase PlsY|nr:glycerol-3-phosphate 1-O-acyltransferase PlsY [Oscillospiraceae bacterium]
MNLLAENIHIFWVNNWFFIILTALIGYLLGSINFSIIITKNVAKQTDIRNMGSGNAGFTNVLRSVGSRPAIFTLIGDVSKGLLAGLTGKYIFSLCTTNSEISSFYLNQYGGYLAGFFCLIGHLYPCFFKFKGGKGIAAISALTFVIDWRIFSVVFGTALIVFFFCKIVSLAAIVGTILYPIATFLITFFDYKRSSGAIKESLIIYIFATLIITLLISLILIYKHKENIKRIINRQEQKIKAN